MEEPNLTPDPAGASLDALARRMLQAAGPEPMRPEAYARLLAASRAALRPAPVRPLAVAKPLFAARHWALAVLAVLAILLLSGVPGGTAAAGPMPELALPASEAMLGMASLVCGALCLLLAVDRYLRPGLLRSA